MPFRSRDIDNLERRLRNNVFFALGLMMDRSQSRRYVDIYNRYNFQEMKFKSRARRDEFGPGVSFFRVTFRTLREEALIDPADSIIIDVGDVIRCFGGVTLFVECFYPNNPLRASSVRSGVVQCRLTYDELQVNWGLEDEEESMGEENKGRTKRRAGSME